MTKVIKSASETREYLIQELKKQLVGPGMSSYEYFSQDKYNHSNEILDKSPRSAYTQLAYYFLKEKLIVIMLMKMIIKKRIL